jgi:hypothetical protein
MDTELILSIGQKLYREKKLTANGLFYLTREPNCSYMAIVIQMTHIYEEEVKTKNLDTRALERIRYVASHYVDILPAMVDTLSDKYLKEYQREVVDAFRLQQG